MKPKTTFELIQTMADKGHTLVLTGDGPMKTKESGGTPTVAGHPFDHVERRVPETKPEKTKDKHVLICMTDDEGLILPDNLTKLCDWQCGRTIQYRPYHPDWIPKVCLHCAAEAPKEFN